MTDGGLHDLVDHLEKQLPELIDEVAATIVEKIDFYRADTVPHDDLRRSVEANLNYVVASMRAPETPPDLAAPRETGRRRAQQGAPLPEILRAYRIGFTAVWDRLAAQARVGPDAALVDVLLDAAAMIWQRTDEYAEAMTDSYRAATTELLVKQQHRRSALVDALFTGEPGPDAGPWEVSRLLNLPPDADLLVVAAETAGTAAEGLPRVERRLADRGIASAWRLTPTQQLGLVALRVGQLDETLALLRRIALTRTGVSPVYRSLRDTPRQLDLARTALSELPAGRADLAEFPNDPLAKLMAHAPRETRRLASDVLGAVLELPADDREILLNTLQTWFDHGGSAERAADKLCCHPNTVRYRLRRLHELTGRAPVDPWQATDLAAALRALRRPAGAHVENDDDLPDR